MVDILVSFLFSWPRSCFFFLLFFVKILFSFLCYWSRWCFLSFFILSYFFSWSNAFSFSFFLKSIFINSHIRLIEGENYVFLEGFFFKHHFRTLNWLKKKDFKLRNTNIPWFLWVECVISWCLSRVCNLLVSTSKLLLPLLCISCNEGVFRMFIDKMCSYTGRPVSWSSCIPLP